MNTEWMEAGDCRQVDPEVFYPGQGGDYKDARIVCGECPVITRCLEFALTQMTDEYDAGSFGMWGGTTEPERRTILAGRAARKRGMLVAA